MESLWYLLHSLPVEMWRFDPLILEFNTVRLSNRFGQFRSLHSINKNTARSFQCDQAAFPLSLRLQFLRKALAFIPLSDGDRLVPGTERSEDHVGRTDTISAAWVGTIHLPGLNQWVGCSPPHHPAYATARRSYCRPKVLSPVLYCTHATNPTQMNRALERISPKPMVDGL